MLKLLLTSLRDSLGVLLVALAVIKILSCQKLSLLVTPGAIGVPDFVNRRELCIWVRVGGTIDVYSSAVCWLPFLSVWKSDVTILLIAKSYQVSWGCLKSWTILRLRLRLLTWHAHWIRVENFVASSSAIWR